MATEVVMPKLGMTMVEGTVEEWLAVDGATVAAGQPIFRLVTEKVNFEVEAETAGVLRHAVAAGSIVPTGQLVAYLLAPGEAPPVMLGADAAAPRPAVPVGVTSNGGSGPASGERVRATPAARRLARELGVDISLVAPSGDGMIHEAAVRAAHERPATAATVATRPADGEVRATPLARRLAEQHGIDLRTLSGSGPGGRIVQDDVERRIAGGSPAAPVAAASAESPPAGATIPMAGMRRTIAERMHASLQEMAQLTLTTEADATELVKLRNQLVEEWQTAGVRPTYTDLVVKASARALREHPRVNASLEGDLIRPHDHVHVGIAVALEEGLIVPVVRDADRLSLKRLARETSALAERARSGGLGYDDVTGGTFSVTSLGMYEIDTFTPIVNPPQAAILGIGRLRDSVSLAGQEVIARQVMALSLTIDHRVLDGAPAAEFLRRVKHLLERPYLLFMDDE